jgi:hypothetical protein
MIAEKFRSDVTHLCFGYPKGTGLAALEKITHDFIAGQYLHHLLE